MDGLAAWRRAGAWLCVLLGAACGSRSRPEPAGDAGVPVAVRIVAGDAAALPEAPRPTDDQQRRYRRHMAMGRRLADAQRPGEAMRAFESALEAIPMDARALSELGWAAFLAGDFDRARSATQDALRVAPDDALRAAGLYNLGRLAEATGDRDEAARSYRDSLALRPHDGVAARLQALGGAALPEPRMSVPQCKPQRTAADLCPCVSPGASSCHDEPRQVPDVALLISGGDTEVVHLVARGQAGWSPVARLGTVRHADDQGVHQELEVVRMDTRIAGERTLLWVETLETREQEDRERGEVEVRRVALVTLCMAAQPSGKRARPSGAPAGLHCPLQVPVREDRERRTLAGDSVAAAATERRIHIEIEDRGVAKVVLVEGVRTDELAPVLGEHRLF